MPEELTDFELIKRFLDGEQSAFDVLVRRYHSRIYWVARRLTGSHSDADDIVQEVLITIYTKLYTFKFNSGFYTWAYRITVRKSLNMIRSKKIKRFFNFEDSESELTGNMDYLKNIEDKQKLEMLDKILQKLPEKQREVFILRNYDELTYEEIADITGKSVGGLKANYFNAFEKVKKYMNEINFE
ncbi:MAG: RNA polymerase sigma factor [Ignavibacteriaceae bacterium]|nr:RNA polymerase sigma factor [Ignavibacteriaceae bacterium]